MKPLLIYLLQVIIASGLLYGYYHIALRNKRFHQYNRFYLLAAVFISILVPFLHIPVYLSPAQAESFVVFHRLENISSSVAPATNEVTSSLALPAVKEPFNWNNLIYIVYAMVALLLLLRIVFSLRKIRSIIKNNTVEELDGVHFINTTEPGTPYSFFRWLFWNKKIELRSEEGEHIFRHEVFHIQQKHSVDRIVMEILTVFFWINPFFHLMKKELKAIHEFLADQFAAHETKKWEYAELLLMQALNTQHQLVNPFFHNQIKRRIAMITNPEKTSHRYLRKLLVLPVAAIVVILFAFKYKSRGEEAPVRANQPITVVIDAAHGGIDPGAKSQDKKFTEAQLTLQLAKTIRQLSSDYNVNVVMTREDDNFPGNVSTKDEALKKRVEIAETANPDAFISLHMNAVPAIKTKNGPIVYKDTETGFAPGASGIEAYTPQRNDARSNELASSILQNVSPVFTTKDKLMQRQHGIYVLDKSKYPSVVLQCGYITNQKDLDFITRPDNQEKLARSILKGIVGYANNAKPVNNVVDTLPEINKYAKALIVIDGKIKSDITFNELDKIMQPNDIESITILKGNSAIDKYGEKGKEGVIEIQSKAAYTLNRTTPKKIDEKIYWQKVDVLEKVEIEAAFPGGNEAWGKYLGRNLDPTIPEKNKAAAGTYTVFVQFIVKVDGSIYDVKALTNHGYGMEQEAVRIIKNSPKWSPAIHYGKPVNAFRKQPINFVVGKTNVTTSSLPLEKIRTIEQDKTTSADIRSLFGDPMFKSVDNHSINWVYKTNESSLSVFFTKTTETVTHFNFTGDNQNTNANINYDKAKEIKENETTFAQLEEFFGKPSQVNIVNKEESWFYEGKNSQLSAMSTNRKSRVINFFNYRNQ